MERQKVKSESKELIENKILPHIKIIGVNQKTRSMDPYALQQHRAELRDHLIDLLSMTERRDDKNNDYAIREAFSLVNRVINSFRHPNRAFNAEILENLHFDLQQLDLMVTETTPYTINRIALHHPASNRISKYLE